ncbi:MAG: zf-HC2 domain-containing protein, partial [Thermoleophilaceae bacterium]
MTVHPRDDLAAYVLGALEPSERELVAGHLDVCADCRTEATAYEQSLWAIAESASLPTPAGLGQRIAARARGPVAIGRRDVG